MISITTKIQRFFHHSIPINLLFKFLLLIYFFEGLGAYRRSMITSSLILRLQVLVILFDLNFSSKPFSSQVLSKQSICSMISSVSPLIIVLERGAILKDFGEV